MPVLYVIATPIGNLEDVSLRALRILGEVVFVDDIEMKRKTIASSPLLKKMYPGEREKEFEMFYLRDVELNWFAFTQAPKEIKEDLPD